MLLLSGALSAVLRSALTTPLNTHTVKGATDNMITNSWEILYAAASDQDNRVLLEGMSLTRDVCCNFNVVR
jgi:hypothetical protein